MENRLWLAVYASLFAVFVLSMIIVVPGIQDSIDSRGTAAADLATAPLSSASPATLTQVLGALESQQQALGQQVSSLDAQMIQLSLNAEFPRTLDKGDTGTDVSDMQSLLAQFADASTTPSGHFDGATASAVSAFQGEVGLPMTGIFDSATRDALTLAIAQAQAAAQSPASTTIDLSSVQDLQTIEALESQVSMLQDEYASSTAALSNLFSQVAGLGTQIASFQSGLQSAVETDPTLFQSTSGIAVEPPLAITSLVAVAVLSKTSATITWTTNNAANSTLIYSTGATLPGSSDKVLTDATLVTNHSETLTSLAANTKYYYEVSSVDGNQSAASSTIFNFTTP